jgi:hypothetical protein
VTKAVELVHSRETHKVLVQILVLKCNLFVDDPGLTTAPSSVRAPVSVDDFRQFVSVLERKDVELGRVPFRGSA